LEPFLPLPLLRRRSYQPSAGCLLHGGDKIGGWPAKQVLLTLLATFRLPQSQQGRDSLRWDLRKLKAHGLLERGRSNKSSICFRRPDYNRMLRYSSLQSRRQDSSVPSHLKLYNYAIS